MSISIDWGTKVISVPQADLTFVSGTFYTLDTNSFRLELRSLEAGFEGMPYDDTHRHNTSVTVAGTTFARTVEIINGYTVEFEDGQYTVQLTGSNNNIFDVAGGILSQNQVQVIPTNSAGLITVTSGSGLSPDQDEKLDELHKLQGLNSTYPMTVTPTSRVVDDISQTLSGDGTTTVTVTRT